MLTFLRVGIRPALYHLGISCRCWDKAVGSFNVLSRYSREAWILSLSLGYQKYLRSLLFFKVKNVKFIIKYGKYFPLTQEILP